MCVYGMAMTERVLQGLIKRSCAVLRGLLVVGQGAARRQGWYDPSSWLYGLGLLLSGIPQESWEERVSPRTANPLLCTVSQSSHHSIDGSVGHIVWATVPHSTAPASKNFSNQDIRYTQSNVRVRVCTAPWLNWFTMGT